MSYQKLVLPHCPCIYKFPWLPDFGGWWQYIIRVCNRFLPRTPKQKALDGTRVHSGVPHLSTDLLFRIHLYRRSICRVVGRLSSLTYLVRSMGIYFQTWVLLVSSFGIDKTGSETDILKFFQIFALKYYWKTTLAWRYEISNIWSITFFRRENFHSLNSNSALRDIFLLWITITSRTSPKNKKYDDLFSMSTLKQ